MCMWVQRGVGPAGSGIAKRVSFVQRGVPAGSGGFCPGGGVSLQRGVPAGSGFFFRVAGFLQRGGVGPAKRGLSGWRGLSSGEWG